VSQLKQEKKDLKTRLKAVKDAKSVKAQEVFPLYENVIEKQIARNAAITSFVRKAVVGKT